MTPSRNHWYDSILTPLDHVLPPAFIIAIVRTADMAIGRTPRRPIDGGREKVSRHGPLDILQARSAGLRRQT
jgi:hypothetical protein